MSPLMELKGLARRWVRGIKDAVGIGEIEVDIYAGAGGASLGISKVTGRPVHVAINHNRHAIAIHRLNHQGTEHLVCDVREADPRTVMPGRNIGLLHLSPDCTHHSRAKGGTPVRRYIRSLANVVIPWIKVRRPRVITLENVVEFLEWGPLKWMKKGKGKNAVEGWFPDPDKKGESFKRWVAKIRKEGYVVEWKPLVAADYGAPTIRKRLFLVARNDGQPITWPKRTHAPRSKAAELGLLPWVPAAACIEWERPVRSIFNRKRPLAEATMKRIANGVLRYVLRSKDGPFIVRPGHYSHITGAGDNFRGQRMERPLGTVCATGNDNGLVQPFLSKFSHTTDGRENNFPVDKPLRTITAKPDGGDEALVAPCLTSYHAEKTPGEVRATGLEQPVPTQDSSNRFGLANSFLALLNHQGEEFRGQDLKDPLHTLTASRDAEGLVTPLFAGVGGRAGQSPPRTVDDPMRTATEKADEGLVEAFLQGAGGPEYQGKPRDIKQPMLTAMKESHQAAVVIRTKKGQGARDPKEPSATATSVASDALAAAAMVQNNTGATCRDAEEPLATITTKGTQINPMLAFMETLYGTTKDGRDARDPMPNVSAQGNHIAEVRAFLVKYYGSAQHGQDVREPAHTLTEKERLGLVTVEGVDYQITDIGLRMLEPTELLKAQFGPYAEGYKLLGTKEIQVAGIGNSVCPQVEEALIRANYMPDTALVAA